MVQNFRNTLYFVENFLFLGTAELCTVEAQLIYDERALSAFVLTPPGEGESERERERDNQPRGLTLNFELCRIMRCFYKGSAILLSQGYLSPTPQCSVNNRYKVDF